MPCSQQHARSNSRTTDPRDGTLRALGMALWPSDSIRPVRSPRVGTCEGKLSPRNDVPVFDFPQRTCSSSRAPLLLVCCRLRRPPRWTPFRSFPTRRMLRIYSETGPHVPMVGCFPVLQKNLSPCKARSRLTYSRLDTEMLYCGSIVD